MRIVETQLDDGTSELRGRLKVEDVEPPDRRQSWIKVDDFDPVPWWKCPPDKAVQHSPVMMRAREGSRPVSLATGRWIERRAPALLMCWYFVERVGVHCDANPPPRSASDDTWIFKSEELEVIH